MHDPSLRRWLRRIDIPTLVIWGSHDGIVDTDYGRAFAAEIPDTEFVLVDEAGHYPHMERPQLVADLLVDFVDRITSHTPDADLGAMAPARS
jgi:pimeloyl-ACP methyl ester carboxylesterase